jgi:hypothetical protein
LAHHSKKKKQLRLPKTEVSILNCTIPPLWPTYIGERRTPFSKAYEIKVRRYGKNVVEILGTHWELERNIVRTHWEAGKNEKKISFPPLPLPPPPPPTPKHKRKKSKAP